MDRPCGAIRFSTAASIAEPMPRPRHCGWVEQNTTQPCSWAARLTQAPTTSSPATATTALSIWQEATTSDNE